MVPEKRATYREFKVPILFDRATSRLGTTGSQYRKLLSPLFSHHNRQYFPNCEQLNRNHQMPGQITMVSPCDHSEMRFLASGLRRLEWDQKI
uniref:Uncharacterized protein n=1 Tax=Vespula pensylvanica TaxID=30213 RepID=A0A834P324_VESPE|nr:hypothetical protein H0235_006556 [Vespula pensylvanica]